MKNSSPLSGLELLQGDLAINFFMVLLSILATLTITIAVISSEGFQTRISMQENTGKPLGLSRGWSPIQQTRYRIAVRDNQIYLLDFTPVAESLVKGVPFYKEILGFDQTKLLENDQDPTAFSLTLFIGNDPLPKELYIWKITADAIQGKDRSLDITIEQFFNESDGFDILVYPDSDKGAWDLAYYLHKKNKKYEMLFQKQGQLGFQRRSELFTFESIYK